VQRAQASETIKCEDKKFDEMYCVFDRDLEKLFNKCLEKSERDKAWSFFKQKPEEKSDEAVPEPDKESGAEAPLKSQSN